MKEIHLGNNEKKNSEKYLNKIEAGFSKGKQRMNNLNINLQKCQHFKRKLIIWSKCRWNIEKWILKKLMSLIF